MTAKIKQKTEADLQAGYEKFLKIINKYFTGERLQKLQFMYSMEELGVNLLTAPASGNLGYHNCYIGGYIDHVFGVTANALKVRDMFIAVGGIQEFTDEELIFSALHHDLGKLGEKNNEYYVQNDSKWHIENRGEYYKRNENLDFLTHTDRTFFTLQSYGISYSMNEYFSIKLTDGMYDEDNQKYLKTFDPKKGVRCKLPYILHWADHMTTVVESQSNVF